MSERASEQMSVAERARGESSAVSERCEPSNDRSSEWPSQFHRYSTQCAVNAWISYSFLPKYRMVTKKVSLMANLFQKHPLPPCDVDEETAPISSGAGG